MKSPCTVLTENFRPKLRELLEKTRKTGNEYGALICRNRSGGFSFQNVCEGDECSVEHILDCKGKQTPYALVHTHPGERTPTPSPEDIDNLAFTEFEGGSCIIADERGIMRCFNTIDITHPELARLHELLDQDFTRDEHIVIERYVDKHLKSMGIRHCEVRI
jgi:proteasome lid subunit RPN8/RPN11